MTTRWSASILLQATGEWFSVAGFDVESVGFNNDPYEAGNPDLIRELIPRIGVFRNVKGTECYITDEEGKVLRQVGVIDSLRKPALYYLSNLMRELPLGYDCEWDGTLYNKANGEFYLAEEGQYYYNIRARRDDTSDWQIISIPVKIDNTPPSFTVPADYLIPYDLSAETITFTFPDLSDGEGTGVDPYNLGILLVDSTGELILPDQDTKIDEEGNLKFTMENPYMLLGDAEPLAVVLVGDYVGNVAVAFVMFSSNDCMVRPVKYSEGGWQAIDGDFIKYNANECEELNFEEGTGKIKVIKAGDVQKVSVNGSETVPFGWSSAITHIVEGVEDGVPVVLTVNGLDADDGVLCSAGGKLLVDKTAPTLSLGGGVVVKTNDKNLFYIDHTTELELTVNDNYAEGLNKVIGFDGHEQFAVNANDDGTLTLPVFRPSRRSFSFLLTK